MFAAAQVERVVRHLVRFGSSRADAEDLAQEALVIAWRKQAELDRDRSLDAWLYGIARNVYRNHVRSARRREAAVPEADDVTSGDPADVIAFRTALGTLTEHQQDIVILHELEEYTLKETAELLAIPFETAKDRLRRAREALREHLQPPVTTAERASTQRIARAVTPAVLAGLLAATSGTASAAVMSKLLLVGVLAGGIVIGVVGDRLLTSSPPAPAPEVVASVPPPDARIVVVDATEIVTRSPDAAVITQRVPMPDAAAPAAPNPDAELVERARVALRRGSASDAIRTLMSHERRFPDGQLAEERDILLVEAYLATGNLKLARARLDHYESTYPSGLHRQRARDARGDLEERTPR